MKFSTAKWHNGSEGKPSAWKKSADGRKRYRYPSANPKQKTSKKGR
jgi:hypothetical protein